jgi:membrane fusion protein, multidrug efflux system
LATAYASKTQRRGGERKLNEKLCRALLAIVVAASVAGCSANGEAATDKKTPGQADEAAIPVEVVAPVRGEVLATYTGTATLEAEADAEVVAKVSAEVRRLAVEEGDTVRAGQLLALLDDRQLRLQAAQTRAAFAKAERDYKRKVELHQKGLVAAGAFESLKYDLENLRAAYDLAQLSLSYTEIRAPFAGIVSARRIKLGQMVQLGDRLFRVTDPTPLKASFFVPERELQRLKIGQPATVQLDALGGQTFPAIVSLVSPTIDATTATFKVTLEVNDKAGVVKPGMFARVGIVFERRANALTIPRAATLESDGATTVFVVAEGKANERTVTLGLSNGAHVEIASGLAAEEKVVVVGQNGLKDGNAVRIVSLTTTKTR